MLLIDKAPYVILSKLMEEISYSGEKPRKTKKLSKRRVLFLIFLVAILALVGGLIFFVTKKNSSSDSNKVVKLEKAVKTATPTMSPAPTSKETPTPTISVQKSNLKISIQNGSGESGVAGTASTLLKDRGYTVVSTGNADSFDYKGITIRIKKSKSSFTSGLIKDLSSKYNLSASDATSDLPETEAYDVLVIVGK